MKNIFKEEHYKRDFKKSMGTKKTIKLNPPKNKTIIHKMKLAILRPAAIEGKLAHLL